MAKLYKFRSLSNLEYVLDIVVNERLYCGSYKDLNDPFEGVFLSHMYPGILSYLLAPPGHSPANRSPEDLGPKKFTPGSLGFKEQKTIDDLPFGTGGTRVCSLSAAFDDVRLWSYYADSHKGVAIEINFEGKVDDLVPVNYKTELETRPLPMLGSLRAEDILSVKSHHWAYEDEFRIIQEDPYYEIPGMITAIYLGVNMPEQTKKLLRKVVPASIPLIETMVDPHSIAVVSAG